ncbi:hypothetical protein [Psychrobacter sp. CAL346-MNA-CIBAN-0220]|uniref:hypothetical protein n=1 Tax=Psychrobacter sp. CAL346-MNA-CIBAN-0220 TaxID=3140457 RepID=UPI0033302C7D
MLLSSDGGIGGYFEFDLPNLGQFPYPQAKKYNSARSAFFDLLSQSDIKKIWMPKFICNSMIEPLLILGIKIYYYDLNNEFYPKIPSYLGEDEYIFYVNYFGLCTSVQQKLLSIYPNKKIIFDHSQAFFVEPFECFGTIYSLRKFLPLAEGGLLISKSLTTPSYNGRSIEEMIQQYNHLFIRRLSDSSQAYEVFKKNEDSLNDCVPKNISKITQDLMDCFDYKNIKSKRLENFTFLHDQLGKINQLNIDIDKIESPLTYPLLLDKKISKELIINKVFTPTYWFDSLERVTVGSFEHRLISNTTHLICDQRYFQKEMQIQINIVKEYL